MKNVVTCLCAIMLVFLACGGSEPADAPPGSNNALNGAKLFNTHCTLCHGKDGALGVSGAKDLRVSSLSKDEMIALVTNGKGAMAPYNNVLTKAQIAAVVAHVRTLQTTE